MFKGRSCIVIGGGIVSGIIEPTVSGTALYAPDGDFVAIEMVALQVNPDVLPTMQVGHASLYYRHPFPSNKVIFLQTATFDRTNVNPDTNTVKLIFNHPLYSTNLYASLSAYVDNVLVIFGIDVLLDTGYSTEAVKSGVEFADNTIPELERLLPQDAPRQDITLAPEMQDVLVNQDFESIPDTQIGTEDIQYLSGGYKD